jgi:hypothetical protein
MKYFLLIGVLLTANVLAQTTKSKKIELEWESKQVVQINNDRVWYMPMVADNVVDFDKMLPTFIEKWRVENNTELIDYKISNIVYETISNNLLYDIAENNIPEKPQISFNLLTNRYDNEMIFQLIPLVKKGNQVKKIISLTLEYTLKPKAIADRQWQSTQNSVLTEGDWYKFSIDTTGIYKLDKSFLQNLGLNLSNINPQNIAVYGNGGQLLPYRIGDFRYDDLQENAIYIEGESDGRFDNNDYILFYAKGPDNWIHNNSINSLQHQKNIYTDKAYYFVHIKTDSGKRISDAEVVTDTPAVTYTNFDDYLVHELELKNLFEAGQQWLGESFDIQNERTIQMNFENIDTTYPVSVKTRAVAASSVSTNLTVKVNNQDLLTLALSATTDYTLAQSSTEIAGLNVNSDDISIQLSYDNGGNPSSECYLDYIEIIGKKNLIVNDKQFSFRNFEMLNMTDPVAFSLQNGNNIRSIWDVTDFINPKKISNSGTGSDFVFAANGGTLHEYIVLNDQDYYTPVKVGKVQNQNLHSLQNVDYVIITKDFLVNDAEVLADYHREHNNLNVKVVPLYQIYNEFGSGAPDITAIRDFVKLLYDNSQPHLQYILLFGDASFDFKGIRYDKGIVPAFESYKSFNMANSFVTDDFYAIVSDDNEGDLDNFSACSQDVAIARVPVNTQAEARDIVAKLLNYYSEMSFGDWRNQMLLIADDIDASSDEELQLDQEALADNIKDNKPLLNIKKIYADAFPQVISAGGSRYPEVNTALGNAIERGVLIADYFGHGGEDGLALERILETSEIEDWHNFNTLPLFIVVSCEFARFDNPLRPNTAGELVIRNSDGGAGHHIATAREITITTGNYINSHLMPLLLEYNGENNSISENMRLVKNQLSTSQRFFVFSLGDPAMRLAIPKPDIKITQMNGVPVTQSLDTIKALSHISFDGIVTHENGVIDTDFNGELSVTIYDKPSDKETLNNDGVGNIMVFDTQESKIFRGSATVTSGAFSFDFVAPRDIRIAYGQGKLSFYADNDIIDKGGYNVAIVIGGIDENAPEDNQGPALRLYMNDESFIDGGTTNQSPLFLAFFEDENGINTSLTAVDHDIVATLDGDQANQIILNDYYTTELDDYTKGSLEYRLRNLDVGLHTIHLKAYDTYNNPAEASLNFVVLDDGELVLNHVLNYPNPFVNYTEFWFNHNKPNEPLEVQIQIFTVSGKLVKTINQTIQNTGGLSREIHWDGLDDFGQKIGKGVYVYKLQVKSSISGLKAKKYEKLVILQ